MSNESVGAMDSDPLHAVADAMDAAVKAAKDGAQNARATAAEALPAASAFLTQAVYKTCYTISYGAVFGSVFVARSIPKENAIVHGLIDGANSAIDMVHEMKNKRTAS